MRPLRFLLAFAAVASLASVACSSSSDDDGTPAGGPPSEGALAQFSSYCTGTLLTERKILRASTGGVWVGDGEKVPAGTKFLVEESFDKWQTGYLFLQDGTVAKLDADFSKGLTKDVDFSTSCASPVAHDRHRLVLLKRATLFPSKDLTGTACTLEAGKGLTSWGYSSFGSGAAELSSPDLKATCAFDKGYSSDIVYGELVIQ